MKIVIKLGGFLFPAELVAEKIRAYRDLISTIQHDGNQLVVVTGGGKNARKYIDAARTLGANEALCDQMGILVSRLNAELFIMALGDNAYHEIPESIEELVRVIQFGKVVVMGGLQPGHSTNAVAALAAETIGASIFVNATNVDGVYTTDPRKDPKAKKLNEISTQELLRLTLGEHAIAGSYELMDTVSVRVIERSHIPTWIVSGEDPENILKVIKGQPIGTRIIS